MSLKNFDERWEKAKEDLEKNTAESIISDYRALVDFFLFCEERIGQEVMQRHLNAWLLTKGGMRFFEETMDSLMDDVYGPEREESEDR